MICGETSGIKRDVHTQAFCIFTFGVYNAPEQMDVHDSHSFEDLIERFSNWQSIQMNEKEGFSAVTLFSGI